MNEEKEIKIECPLSYSLSTDNEEITANGGASGRIDEESLSVIPEFGEPLYLSLRDISDFSADDYKIQLLLTSGEKLILSDLGYKFDDFVRALSRQRNEVILKDMLMQENMRKSEIIAEVVFTDEEGIERRQGMCELRLYDTAIVIMPENGEVLRMPYSNISGFRESDYSVIVNSEDGEKIVLSQMGSQYGPFKKSFSEAMNKLALNVQSSIKELFPAANPAIIRKISTYMKEGRAARKSDIESVLPELWMELERKLEICGLKEEYDFLKPVSRQERLCIGIKRGLMADLTGEYIWFLVPVYDTDSDKPGNAVIMEASSDEGSGKATYVFRIAGRKDYKEFRDIQILHNETDKFIKKINRCMVDINFRREPVYLSDEKMKDPQYTKYIFSIQKLPSLKILREHFIGRVVHSSSEQWKSDVMDLLRFNVSTLDDKAKWKKNEK